MSLWSKIKGTIESFWQIGLGGPQLKNNAGVIEARNPADSGFVVVRGATPVTNNDLVTKQYADTLNKPIVVSQQFDGNNALPSNSGVEQFYIVTTTGPNATIGQLLWDDGSGVGTVTVLTALEGRSVFTAAAFTGGTISLRANAYYVWDSVSSSWLLEAGANIAGALREIRYVISNAATQDSATPIPPNAFVTNATLKVTTPYSGGASVSLGQPGSPTLFQLTTDNLPQANGSYEVVQDTPNGVSPAVVRTTIAGAPAAGAGVVIVQYVVPDA